MGVGDLYVEHEPSLRRYLERLTGDLELSADTLQETYLRLLANPPREPGNTRAWLFRVATNLVRDEWRRRHRPLVELEPAEAPDQLEAIARRERLEVVRRLLARIPKRQRTVLLMREEGFTYRAIAEALEISHNSVGPLAGRGLARLERLLREAGEDGS